MKALRWKRRQRHCADPVQVSPHAAHMSAMTTSTAAAPTVTTPAERAAAGRQAIADCPEAFEELQGEGDRELVEHAASKDENILQALEAIGELSTDEAPYLGKFLAEQLVEDAIEAETQKQLGAYRAARRNAAHAADQALAYEANDPKHPDFLDRIGA
ncbi:hypothetical protein SAMN04489738_0574 [Pseudarthrobacter chlorophenolicus]|nr:hypothetical protein SAMN04489738_0574 [Pseudarthrobacter chlorophenolicus]